MLEFRKPYAILAAEREEAVLLWVSPQERWLFRGGWQLARVRAVDRHVGANGHPGGLLWRAFDRAGRPYPAARCPYDAAAHVLEQFADQQGD